MKNNKLGVKRVFVNREALLRGERIEKTQAEMSAEEYEKFRDDFTDNLMRSLGFIKKPDLNDDTA